MSNVLPENPLSYNNPQAIITDAWKVLDTNYTGVYHMPHCDHYKGLFGWDSPMHAIGTRHDRPAQAAMELTHLFRGQWRDGMIPNIQFPARGELLHGLLNASGLLARGNAPRGIRTSGITQPPLEAEAVWLVGKKLGTEDRRSFWGKTVPWLVRYHEWLYAARCEKKDGIIEIVHPWESGMDNTPPIIEYMRTLTWGKTADIVRSMEKVITHSRKDLRHVDDGERSSAEEAALQTIAMVSIMRNRYDARRLQENHPLHVADIGFNSIFARANTVLELLAEEIGLVLADDLKDSMHKTRQNFSSLRDPRTGLYFSRDRKGELIPISTIASLLPLYSGALSVQDTKTLANHLANPKSFWRPYGVPTVPVDSPFFDEKRYWSGGVWGNMEWMLTTGLARSGCNELAEGMRKTILSTNPAFYEYHSARTGEGYGVRPFSWSASVRLDLAHRPNDTSWRD
ncbi:MAG: hypothetical protein WAW63_03130 [Candidatus Saccharimonadales bacterium]